MKSLRNLASGLLALERCIAFDLCGADEIRDNFHHHYRFWIGVPGAWNYVVSEQPGSPLDRSDCAVARVVVGCHRDDYESDPTGSRFYFD